MLTSIKTKTILLIILVCCVSCGPHKTAKTDLTSSTSTYNTEKKGIKTAGTPSETIHDKEIQEIINEQAPKERASVGDVFKTISKVSKGVVAVTTILGLIALAL